MKPDRGVGLLCKPTVYRSYNQKFEKFGSTFAADRGHYMQNDGVVHALRESGFETLLHLAPLWVR